MMMRLFTPRALGATWAPLCALIVTQSACIFAQEQVPMTPKADMGAPDLTVSQDMRPASDLSSSPDAGQADDGVIALDMEPVCEAPAEPGLACCPGVATPVMTAQDPAHCGGCGVACASGAACLQGQCVCPDGALGRTITAQVQPTTRFFVLPFISPERLLGQDDPKSFYDIFKDDPALATYAVVAYTPGQNVISVFTLDGLGRLMQESKLTPRSDINDVVIKNVLASQGDGLVLLVHFERRTGGVLNSEELRVYATERVEPNGFALVNPLGERLGRPVAQVLAIGANRSSLDGLALAFITRDQTINRPVLTTLVFNQATPMPDPTELPRDAIIPDGTELQVGWDKDAKSAAVSWWQPRDQGASGDFYQALYGLEQGRYVLARGPEIYADTSRPANAEPPRSQPIYAGVLANGQAHWRYFQVTHQPTNSFVELWDARLRTPEVTVTSAPAAFGQDWTIQLLRDRRTLEFVWAQREREGDRAATGRLHVARVESLYEDGEGGAPRASTPQPLSSASSYLSARAVFGSPGTVGYVALRPLSQTQAALDFYMTRDGQVLCSPPTP